MAWSYVGVSSVVTVTSGNITLTEPAGVANGDLLIAVIAYRSNAAFTAPAGWTAVEEQNSGNTTVNGTGSIASGKMVYRIRSGAPGLTFTRTGGDLGYGRIIAYRGANQTAPLVASSSFTAVTALSSASTVGITTTGNNDLIVAAMCGARATNSSAFRANTDPTGNSSTANDTAAPTAGQWRERADSTTTSGADGALAIGDAIRSLPGATGTILVTESASARHVMIAAAFSAAQVEAVASAAGTAAADAVGLAVSPAVAGAAGTSTAAAVGDSFTLVEAVADAAGTSTASAESRATAAAVATSAGTSTASAVGAAIYPQALIDGIVQRAVYLTGTVKGPARITGIVNRSVSLGGVVIRTVNVAGVIEQAA